MPPKKSEAPPPPVEVKPVDPAVVAATNSLDRWTSRRSEVTEKLSTTSTHLQNLLLAKNQNEQRIKELFSTVQALATPKPAEPQTPETKVEAKATKPGGKQSSSKTSAANEPPPPSAPVLTEEELKRIARNNQILFNAFRKRRDKAAAKAADAAEALSGSAVIVEEPTIAKPPEIAEDLWSACMKMRDERLRSEESLATVRQNIESVSGHAELLKEMERVAKYAADAAEFELRRAKELALAAPPPAAETVTAPSVSPVPGAAKKDSSGAQVISAKAPQPKSSQGARMR